MKNFVRNALSLTIGMVIGMQLMVGESEQAQAKTKPEGQLPLAEVRAFTEVFAKVKTDYVEEVKDKALLENAIRGMLSGLDPHSAYLDAEAYEGLQEGTTGEFGGLGIEVGMEDGFVKIIAPIDDTPAFRAGVKAGDVIVKIEDRPVKGMDLNEAVKLMRGKPGTPITLTIVREGQETPLTLTLTREVIKVHSVKSKTLEPNYGYIRISQFQAHTGEELGAELNKLKEQNKNKLTGLVLDLRNNPGGILGAAVAVADAFLESGRIVYTKGRVAESDMQFNAKPGDALHGAPIVVLVNGGSASASEIVAGALQDTRRGVIMGSKTFGKGSVQTIVPMSNDTALKLTTARYYTPSGRSIQAEGVTPDIVLDKVKIAGVEKAPGPELKEADLSRHLQNGDAKAKSSQEAAKSEGEKSAPLVSSDYELYQALNLLKGMSIAPRH
jgi:carboxyl-terminal processing protease